MKSLFYIFILATAAAFTCHANNSFVIGTNAVSIAFSINDLPQSDKNFISSDLAKIFSFAKTIDAAFKTSQTPGQLELKRFPAPQPFPDFLDDDQISISCSNGTFTAELCNELVSKYLDAKIFAQTNAVLLGQFDGIMTAFNNGSVTNLSAAAQKEVFWTPKSGEISDAKMSEIIHIVSSKLILHNPSVLNYGENLPLGYDNDDAADIFAFVVATHRTTGEFATVYGIARVDNNIKLYVF
jgi:hypothetical protein